MSNMQEDQRRRLMGIVAVGVTVALVAWVGSFIHARSESGPGRPNDPARNNPLPFSYTGVRVPGPNDHVVYEPPIYMSNPEHGQRLRGDYPTPR